MDSASPAASGSQGRRGQAIGVLAVVVAAVLGLYWMSEGGGASSQPPLPGEQPFDDPLDTSSPSAFDIERSPMTAIAAVGDRLLAVGLRGLLAQSADGGKSWQQISVPVSSDLTAIRFIDEKRGWIAGHEGVVLHSEDGGATWTKQMDGRSAAIGFVKFYQDKVDGGDESFAKYVVATQQNYASGPAYPYLDLWFENGNEGYAVGTFGMLASTQDGGRTWEPWIDRIDNKMGLNLNAVRNIAGDLYIAGERGRIYRLNRQTRFFDVLNTGYNGSFFGIVGDAERLVAFGLRGSVYESRDRGASWTRVEVPSGVELTYGTEMPDGHTLLLDSTGGVLVSDGAGYKRIKSRADGATLTGIALQGGGQAVVSSLQGLRTIAIDVAAPAAAEPDPSSAAQPDPTSIK